MLDSSAPLAEVCLPWTRDEQRSIAMRGAGRELLAHARSRAEHHLERVIRGVSSSVLVAMVSPDTTLARQQLKEAQGALQSAGAVAETELVAGEPQQVMPELVRRQAPARLVMGAFGHTRLRQWLVGSTTTSLR